MTQTIQHIDGFTRWLQLSGRTDVRLVRIVSGGQGNVYSAVAVEFDGDGATQAVDERELAVVNLAEPSDQAGALPADAEAVAIDVEGRWVIYVRQADTSFFPARIASVEGDAEYSVVRQEATGLGQFADEDGAPTLTAHNLAELSLGPGAAVDVGIIVLVMPIIQAGETPTTRYVFDHPVYAKYLD